MAANLPRQVKKQIEDAARIQAELDAAARGEAPPQPALQPAPEPPAPQPEPQPENIEDTQWEQKYNTLQAKYNAEVPRLTQTIRAQTDQMAQMAGDIQSLKLLVNQQPQQPAAPAPTSDASPEEIEVYGADLVALIERRAKAMVDAATASLKTENADLRKQVGGLGERQEVSERDRFMMAMDTLVEGWRVTNVHPAFLDWCAGQDLLTGTVRQELLSTAVQALDPIKTSNFFKVFWSEQPALKPKGQAPAPAVETPAPPVPEGSTLEEEVVPNRRVTGPTNAPAPGRQIPRSEISAFYTEVVLGKWKKRPQEQKAREDEFYKARQEGRITDA